MIEEAADKLAAYNRADRDEAEELYGDYVDVVETGTRAPRRHPRRLRATLAEGVDEEYEAEFNRAVAQARWPAFALEIENR